MCHWLCQYLPTLACQVEVLYQLPADCLRAGCGCGPVNCYPMWPQCTLVVCKDIEILRKLVQNGAHKDPCSGRINSHVILSQDCLHLDSSSSSSSSSCGFVEEELMVPCGVPRLSTSVQLFSRSSITTSTTFCHLLQGPSMIPRPSCTRLSQTSFTAS